MALTDTDLKRLAFACRANMVSTPTQMLVSTLDGSISAVIDRTLREQRVHDVTAAEYAALEQRVRVISVYDGI